MDNDIHYKEGKKKKKKSNKDNERKTKLGPTATWTDAYCAFQAAARTSVIAKQTKHLILVFLFSNPTILS